MIIPFLRCVPNGVKMNGFSEKGLHDTLVCRLRLQEGIWEREDQTTPSHRVCSWILIWGLVAVEDVRTAGYSERFLYHLCNVGFLVVADCSFMSCLLAQAHIAIAFYLFCSLLYQCCFLYTWSFCGVAFVGRRKQFSVKESYAGFISSLLT